MKTFSWVAVSWAILGLFVEASFGQYPPAGGVVSGSGIVSIERMPEGMRMSVMLTAKGKDLKEALASLKDRTDAAKAQLATLGADKTSVKTESPQLSAGKTTQQRQMEMMMANQLRGKGGAKKPKKEDKPPVTVSATLTAQWLLKAKEAEELLIATAALQEKIKAADLAGSKEDSKLSPDEEELLAEMESSGYGGYGAELPKPGEPTFHFYTAITDVEREKALGEAFKKAKENAARVAKAAGCELGKLASLNETETGADSDADRSVYERDPNAYQILQSLRSSRGDDSGPAEGIGVQPGKVTYRVSVHAAFELKAP